MEFDIPIQIVRESTLVITEKIRKGLRGTNPLSDRLWNIGTTLFYKCGRKPWKTPWARDGVCYVGLAFRRDDRDKRTACCAAQMFLGDVEKLNTIFIFHWGEPFEGEWCNSNWGRFYGGTTAVLSFVDL
jgi:hypothetical protein